VNDLGYNPCPECGCTEVDYGKYEKKRYIYAECSECRHEVIIPVYDDTWHNLRIADIVRLTREVWNGSNGI
jgi:hypothetical protein